jgi:putative membrane protein
MTEMDDPKTYFAAERTFLAWIRTGLGLMGVGFAVARFGFFLSEFRGAELHAPAHGLGLSVYSGVALVILGVLVNVSAVTHHLRTIRELQAGSWKPRISRNGIALGLLLALVGAGDQRLPSAAALAAAGCFRYAASAWRCSAAKIVRKRIRAEKSVRSTCCRVICSSSATRSAS